MMWDHPLMLIAFGFAVALERYRLPRGDYYGDRQRVKGFGRSQSSPFGTAFADQ